MGRRGSLCGAGRLVVVLGEVKKRFEKGLGFVGDVWRKLS